MTDTRDETRYSSTQFDEAMKQQWKDIHFFGSQCRNLKLRTTSAKIWVSGPDVSSGKGLLQKKDNLRKRF